MASRVVIIGRSVWPPSSGSTRRQARRLPRWPGRAGKHLIPATDTVRGRSTGRASGTTSPGRRDTLSAEERNDGPKWLLQPTTVVVRLDLTARVSAKATAGPGRESTVEGVNRGIARREEE